jgi:HK97 family phage prohead protease
MESLEFRSTPVEFRADDNEDGEHFAWLRVCNFNVADAHGTSWDPEVFDESLIRKLPKFVFAHQAGVKGQALNIVGKTVEYRKDETGLDVRVRFSDFDAVPEARRVHSHLQRGEIDELSFGFRPRKTAPDPYLKGVERVMKADLHEVSPVLVGSVPGTRVLDIREAPDETVAALKEAGVAIEAILELATKGELSDVGEIALRADKALTVLRTANEVAPPTEDEVTEMIRSTKPAEMEVRSEVDAEMQAALSRVEAIMKRSN